MIYKEEGAANSTVYRAQIKNQWQIPLLHQFLQISPTYRKAHLFSLDESVNFDQLPNDFQTVLKVFEDFGDVWGETAEDWWLQSARKQFEAAITPHPSLIDFIPEQAIRSLEEVDKQHHKRLGESANQIGYFWVGDYANQLFPDCAIIGVPLRGSKSAMKREVSKMIDVAFSKAKQPIGIAKYSFNTKSRIRKATLEKCLFAVLYKANNPGIKLAEIGEEISQQFDHKKISSPNQQQEQRNLEAQTSEMLGHARILAEWAARLDFPCKSPLNQVIADNSGSGANYKPEFDFDFIAKQITAGNIQTP